MIASFQEKIPRWVPAALTIFMLVVILGIVGQAVRAKETTITNGQEVLLKLAPVDPRSLMQGDYMILRYALAVKIASDHQDKWEAGLLQRKGLLVLKKSPEDEWDFVRFHQGEDLAPGEILLRYRYRNDEIDLGAESFFFPEGQAATFDRAGYGELRVDAAGDSVLIGLRDEKKQPLGVSIHRDLDSI